MTTREGKALRFVRVPVNYAEGIQEGDSTPVYIEPDGTSGIPPVDPATAGNLVVLLADGTLEDAGYGVEQDSPATPSVVRRDNNRRISNYVNENYAIEGGANDGYGVSGVSQTGSGMRSSSSSGLYHHEFGSPANSAILRTTGALTFLGASAAANRNAQLTQLFASIPTVAGAVGTLWNDGGTIKIVI